MHHHQQQQQAQQEHHQQQQNSTYNHHHHHGSSRHSITTNTFNFTNTAKLPIETVKLLIASVSRRPNLWIRTSNGQKRGDINSLWQQVANECSLPADICRIKWGHLRDNFRKVFIRNTFSGEPPTTWRFYNDMRFMEAAVAENVMRQHRLREQSMYWQELHTNNTGSRQRTSQSDYDNKHLQNQFNFNDLTLFFNGTTAAPDGEDKNASEMEMTQGGSLGKRIKLEKLDSDTSSQENYMSSGKGNCNESSSSNNHNAKLDDDDDYDEDNIDDDEIFPMSLPANNADTMQQQQQQGAESNNKNRSLSKTNDFFNTTCHNNSNIKQDKSTNTEVLAALNHTKDDPKDEDSDRLFLLSLLPYLQKVKEQRKLQVRQKLQNVLIEEFG